MSKRGTTRDGFPLTDEHRMLLRIRDTLYEGNWEDFIRDLTAKSEGKPHVFETVPASPEMKATIDRHLRLIRDMRSWEEQSGDPLDPEAIS